MDTTETPIPTDPTPGDPARVAVLDRLDALHGAVRLLLGGLAAWVLGVAALAAVFVGIVLTTGCFLSCDTPRPEAGVPLLVASGVLAVAAVQVLAWVCAPGVARAAGWRRVLGVGTGVGLVVATAGAWSPAPGVATLTAGLLGVVVVVPVLRGRPARAPWDAVRAVVGGWVDAVAALPRAVRAALAGAVVVGLTLAVVTLVADGRCPFTGIACQADVPLLEREALRLVAAWAGAAGAALVLLAGRAREPRAWLAAAAGAGVLGVAAGLAVG